MKVTANFDTIGVVGLLLTALTSPCCFPLFGIVLSAFGLGSFELFGGWTIWVFQGLVLLSLIGTFLSYRQHRNILPIAVGVFSGFLIFFIYHFHKAANWTNYFLALSP